MTFLQAIVIGVIQGVAELFPISSLGHTVIIPAFIGGSWSHLVTQQASAESPYLAFVVGLHVATALALILYFWGLQTLHSVGWIAVLIFAWQRAGDRA